MKNPLTLQDIIGSLYELRGLRDPEGKSLWSDKQLVSFWYKMTSEDLAHTFKAQKGLKFILNGDKVSNWKNAAEALFPIADFIAIRDTRPTEQEVGTCFMPQWPLYDRKNIQRSERPFLLKALGENGYWANDKIEIAGKGSVAGMLYFPQIFKEEVYGWLFRDGRTYHETGRVIFAPFIPDYEIEKEFLKNGLSIPRMMDADPIWDETHDALNEQDVMALVALNIPKLHGLSFENAKKIREDYRDEFERFSRSIVKAITSIKASSDNENFFRSCRSIQRDLIDDNIDKLNTRYKQISLMKWAGYAGIAVGVTALKFSGIHAGDIAKLTTGLAPSVAGAISVAASKYKEQFGAYENPMHFLYRLKNRA